jgi:hypothetical protein
MDSLENGARRERIPSEARLRYAVQILSQVDGCSRELSRILGRRFLCSVAQLELRLRTEVKLTCANGLLVIFGSDLGSQLVLLKER